MVIIPTSASLVEGDKETIEGSTRAVTGNSGSTTRRGASGKLSTNHTPHSRLSHGYDVAQSVYSFQENMPFFRLFEILSFLAYLEICIALLNRFFEKE